MKKYIIPSLALLAALPATAQFDQTITVEGKYVPEIIRIDRINAFPSPEKFSLESTPLAYDSKSTTAAFSPKLYSIPALGWNDTRTISRNRGYLELGAGSWLNSTLSAGYRFVDNESSLFGVRLQHNSTSLWKPSLSEATADIKRRNYDETIGLYGAHLFPGKGRLEASADYHIGNFNYFGYNPVWHIPNLSQEISAPTQTLNDIAARIGWQSDSKPDNISYNFAAGVRYFGYRRMYDVPDARINTPIAYGLSSLKSTRETDIYLNGGFRFPTSTKSALGIDLKANLLTYSGYDVDKDITNPLFHPENPATYGMVTLTPFYQFSISGFNLRLGADIDIAAKAGPENNRYDLFHFAPDVRVDYDAGAARLFLHLLGGSSLHTLASGYELDYYQQPFMLNTTPVYTPLDGEFGATFGPFSGFSAGVGFAFRVSRGQYTGGWYQTLLNYGRYAYGADVPYSFPQTFAGNPANYDFLEQDTYNIHGWSLRANVNYDLGKIFKISAQGAYQRQNGEAGYFNGLDRPRWVAGISAQTNPWRTLKLKLAYNYRGVRNAFIIGNYHNDKGFDESFLTAMRLKDVTSLDFGASYAFSEKFSAWLQADNLLNRHIDLLPGLPTQGITFAAGISWLF